MENTLFWEAQISRVDLGVIIFYSTFMHINGFYNLNSEETSYNDLLFLSLSDALSNNEKSLD